MTVSGLKRGMEIVCLAGGLFAASFAIAGEAEGAEMSSSDSKQPAKTDTYGDEVAADPADQKSAARERAPQEGASRADAAVNAQTMLASYYGRELEGNPTASGEIFDADAYTAAHKSLPLGTRLRVSLGGESAVVTVNDRGPYVPGRDLDLSLAAAEDIGLTYSGTAPVQVVIL